MSRFDNTRILQILNCLIFSSFFTVAAQRFDDDTEELKREPKFLAPIRNQTVLQGHDVVFSCVITDAGSYMVY